ncbi:uncharacterized protein BJX67DRAFT_13580 [Aspergillus lucknowensis]|uniref:Uncharacterized protein n=1 Tax=Aspergillus lucknowensis TaxID=176173 RepID=A0ABR4M7M7_9EURO
MLHPETGIFQAKYPRRRACERSYLPRRMTRNRGESRLAHTRPVWLERSRCGPSRVPPTPSYFQKVIPAFEYGYEACAFLEVPRLPRLLSPTLTMGEGREVPAPVQPSQTQHRGYLSSSLFRLVTELPTKRFTQPSGQPPRFQPRVYHEAVQTTTMP